MSENSNTVEVSKEEWIQICATRPDAFAHYYFSDMIRFKSSRLHFLLYDLIKQIPETEYSVHAAIAAPRGNAKTVIMSIILPIWCAALEKKRFMFLISETSRMAEANLESIKYELTTNEKLMQDFPEVCGEGRVWRQATIETKNGIRLVAAGSGNQIRGSLFKAGARPDLLLFDDIDSTKNSNTLEQRIKHRDWFTKDALGMRGAGSKMDAIVCGTIINAKSLLNSLISSKDFPGWKKHIFRAIEQFSQSPLWDDWEQIYANSENTDAEQDSRNFFEKHKEDMLKDTQVLWPEGDDYYNLMVWKLQNGARAFHSEKQNNPLDPSARTYDPETIVYYTDDELNLSNCDIFGALDPASGQAKSRGDNTAIVFIAKNRKTGIMYVLSTYIKPVPISVAVTHIKEMCNLFSIKKFGVDSDALKLIKDYLETHVPGLNIVLYDLRLKKGYRFQRMEPLISTGMIRFKKNQTKLVEEVEMHPQVDHDDGLDALEIATRVAGNRGYKLLTY